MINRQAHTIKLGSVASAMGVITAILMLVNVIMSTRVSQDGLVIDELSKRQETLKSTIHDLEQRLYAQTSLNDLSVKAEQLGYTPTTSIQTISTTTPIAYNQQ